MSSNPSSEMKEVERKFRSLHRLVVKFQIQVSSYDSSTPIEVLQIGRTEIKASRDELRELIYSYSAECSTDAEVDAFTDKTEATKLTLDTAEVKLCQLQKAFGTSGSSISTSVIGVKLPKLELPTFSGSYEDWLSFRDQFTSSISSSSSLSLSSKLQYLKSCCKGDAERMIKAFAITDANFSQAWSLLTDRYDNTREIVNSLLKKLVAQPKLSKENVISLRKMLDITLELLRSLTTLGVPVDKWDTIIIFILVEKLDPDSKKEWTRLLKGTNLPTFKEFQDFLEGHIRCLMANSTISSSSSSPGHKKDFTSHHSTANSSCPCCGEGHPVFKCKKFHNSSVEEKLKVVKSGHLCYNCLSPHHGSKDCKVEHRCKKCNSKHHTSLHRDSSNHSEKVVAVSDQSHHDSSAASSSYQSSSVSMHSKSATQVLLCTAVVQVENSVGNRIQCRALIDQGSQSSFVTSRLVNILQLTRKKSNTTFSGIGSCKAAKSQGIVSLTISSSYSSQVFNVNAEILSQVTGLLPTHLCTVKYWPHIQGLQLADPKFFQPRDVDMLLGADIAARLFMSGKIEGPELTPVAQESVFGWILSGPVKSSSEQSVHTVLTHHSICETESILKKFWESEKIPDRVILTKEEQKSENHFMATHFRAADGRYVVQLPFNEKINSLGSSRDMAIKRFKQVEKRLDRHPHHSQEYHKFMKEYQDLGHMELIPADQFSIPNPSFYLPHHFVIKEDSSTTKLRVVFDGSAQSSTGISLNQCLLVGPTIQSDLFTILVRFRSYPIVIKADIAKMYRQFKMNPLHQDYQRILWRDSISDPIQDFRLTTVTYGTASAPFSATRCLKQLIMDEGESTPAASLSLDEDTYVDDLMTGAGTVEEAIQLRRHLSDLVSKGCMELRKFDSNCKEVLLDIPHHLCESNPVLPVSDSSSKALGVSWNSTTDKFNFSRYVPNYYNDITKRQVLSELARIFDPLGLLSPVTVRVKVFFQQVWNKSVDHHGVQRLIDWDDILPPSLQAQWNSLQEDMSLITNVQIPRFIKSYPSSSLELHGFSDSSEYAMSACVYLRCISGDGSATASLIAAKTKVAPIKQQSIPKLELCGALLLSKLVTSVTSSLKLNCPVYGWTDSENVLKWLFSSSRRWKTFVANRVAEIQELIPSELWHYVPSELNPADCASRGLSVPQLIDHSLWWNGPSFLRQMDFPFFPLPTTFSSSECLEERKKVFLTSESIAKILTEKYSSFNKVIRVTAFVRRFIFNCKSSSSNRIISELTAWELEDSSLFLIRLIQHEHYQNEIKALESGKSIPSSSPILSLNPELDHQGVLKVGGRLQNSSLPESTKFPIIIPGSDPLTKLIIRHHHLEYLHAGFQLLLSTLQRKYWIIRARDVIRQVIRKCVICRRHRANTMNQLMGNLPSPRVNPSRVFLHVGVDYAGPFTIQVRKGRGQKQFKCYFAIFVCLAVKAVHLEPVTELTTDAFIATLKRFIARRGHCTDLYSDCGSNFKGADKELHCLLESARSDYSTFLSQKSITWHFNPPSAPHQGGLWEAGVKSVKYHLRRIIGTSSLTLEEFHTLLCQVEAVLNSRPLCSLSTDPTEFDVLTPGHFLVGTPLTSIPEPNLLDLNFGRLDRWQRVTQMTQQLWSRWTNEYLSSLQQRYKWKKKQVNPVVGDLVIIHDDNLPPLHWKLGRIIDMKPGKDQLVRVIKVKTSSGELSRPIHKICPLLSSSDL